jgi:hypothetical protein
MQHEFNDYYSIDRFLAEAESIPCLHNVGSLNIARELNSQCDSEHLRMNSEISLPFWLAKALSEKFLVNPQMDTAKVFPRTVWSKIKAEAKIVNLQRDYSDSFFELAGLYGNLLLSTYKEDEDDDDDYEDEREAGRELLRNAREAFSLRFKKMLMEAHNQSDPSFDVDNLTRCERRLFKSGKDSAKAFMRWKYATSEVMVASKVVTEARKRKQMTNRVERREPLKQRNF